MLTMEIPDLQCYNHWIFCRPLACSLADGDVAFLWIVYIQATVNWFRIYKMPTGKPPNVFPFEGQPKDRVLVYWLISVVSMAHFMKYFAELCYEHCGGDPWTVEEAHQQRRDGLYLMVTDLKHPVMLLSCESLEQYLKSIYIAIIEHQGTSIVPF